MLTGEAVNKEGLELQLTAALGTKWAHSVNIRLVLESLSGTNLKQMLNLATNPQTSVQVAVMVL